MRIALALLLGCLSASLTLWSLLALRRLPDPFARPLWVPYAGETLRNVPLSIPVGGEYQVALEVPHAAGELIDAPTRPPLRVVVSRNGASIGEASHGGSWGSETDEINVYRFEARKGDSVFLDVSPGFSLGRFVGHRPRLVMRRVPIGYADYFIAQGFWWALIMLLAMMSLLCLAVAYAIRQGERLRNTTPNACSPQKQTNAPD